MPGDGRILHPVYVSAGCNRSPNCLAWRKSTDDMGGDSTVLYASCCSVVVAGRLADGGPAPSSPLEVEATLCGHDERVNCVRFVGDDSDCAFLTASVDKTAAFWKKTKEGRGRSSYKRVKMLKGHQREVTVADGVKVGEGEYLVATTSGDATIRTWIVKDDVESEVSCAILDLRNRLCMDLRTVLLGRGGAVMMLAAMEDCSVHVYGSSASGGGFSLRHKLKGHEDWVRSVDAIETEDDDVLVASGGQDGFVRVWRMSPKREERSEAATATGRNTELRVKEEIFDLQEGRMAFSVSLETVLAGHEDKVFSVQWRRDPAPPALLTASMDKTMIVWSPPAQDEGGDAEQTWTESVRLGDVGGNQLGFLGAQFDPSSSSGVMGYSFNGAFHPYHCEGDAAWEPGVPMGGHSDRAVDLDWDVGGRYLLTAGADQTTRAHAPWKREGRSVWREVARPQVHGYDMSCMAVLPGGGDGGGGHRLASGAEEKVVRIFQATATFLKNLFSIAGSAFDGDASALAQGASVPSLGLSNKAVAEGQTVTPEGERHVKDQYPDHYFKSESYSDPPPEETLVQNTLWPELQKLYGHGYDVFCLAAHPSGDLLASACKAAKAEHAEVLLWDTRTWQVSQRLRAHNLTVTQMEFSPDGGRRLLTASRDRTWCLFEWSGTEEGYKKAAWTDKSCSVHQRLIWSCSWSPDSSVFATASRDKKLVVWGRTTKSEGTSSSAAGCLGDYGMACKKPLVLSDSVTAVAFAPNRDEKGRYLLAAGLESGRVVLARWDAKAEGEKDEWELLEELDRNAAHHRAVKRIRFKRLDGGRTDGLAVATCGHDHAVKIFSLHL